METKRILSYIQNNMSELERKKFEAEMETDLELKKIVQEHQMISQVSDYALEKKLLHEVESVSSSLNETQATSSQLPKILLGLFVLIMIILSIIYIKYSSQSGELENPQKYAHIHYEEPMWPITRGDGNYVSYGVAAGLEGDIEEAKVYLLDSVKNVEGKYWLAEILYKQEKYAESLSLLSDLQSKKYEERIEYMKVLNLINLGKSEEASTLINSSQFKSVKDLAF